MSEFERGEQLNAIVRSWNPEAERLKHQIERARDYVEKHDGIGIYRSTLLAILSEDASDANETREEGARG